MSSWNTIVPVAGLNIGSPVACGAVVIVMESDWLWVRPPLLTRTVKVDVPAAVGVPTIAPTVWSDSPAGSEPVTIDQLNVPLPPVAASVWLYATPTVPLGSDVVTIVG